MGQSMIEMGGIVAGSSVGSAAGKKLSDSLNSTLNKTAQATEKAAKEGKDSKSKDADTKAKQQTSQEVPAPLDPAFLPPRPKGSSAELDNVPPPPPSRRKAQPQPVRASRSPAPVVVPVRYEVPKPAPLNVDLSKIEPGTHREVILKLGAPSARISMFESGHLVEIYNYRNTTFPSGRIHLEDGSVTSVELH